jgi:hypothetical protein
MLCVFITVIMFYSILFWNVEKWNRAAREQSQKKVSKETLQH